MLLISASDDKTIRVWNLKTGKEEPKILGQIGSDFGEIYAIALSPDQTQLAVGGYYEEDVIRGGLRGIIISSPGK